MRFTPKSFLATAFAVLAAPAFAAPCGNDASGFNAWKQAFAQEAAGVGSRACKPLQMHSIPHRQFVRIATKQVCGMS